MVRLNLQQVFFFHSGDLFTLSLQPSCTTPRRHPDSNLMPGFLNLLTLLTLWPVPRTGIWEGLTLLRTSPGRTGRRCRRFQMGLIHDGAEWAGGDKKKQNNNKKRNALNVTWSLCWMLNLRAIKASLSEARFENRSAAKTAEFRGQWITASFWKTFFFFL